MTSLAVHSLGFFFSQIKEGGTDASTTSEEGAKKIDLNIRLEFYLNKYSNILYRELIFLVKKSCGLDFNNPHANRIFFYFKIDSIVFF